MGGKFPDPSSFGIFMTDKKSAVQEGSGGQNHYFGLKFCAHRHANTGNFGFSEGYRSDKILPNI